MKGGFGKVKEILERGVAEIGSVSREGSTKLNGVNSKASDKK